MPEDDDKSGYGTSSGSKERATAIQEELAGTYPDSLGVRLTEATPVRLIGYLDVTDQHKQVHGIVDGGVYASIVEAFGSIGGSLNTSPDEVMVGVENRTDFLRACHGGRIDIEAVPVDPTETSELWIVSMRQPDTGKLYAQGRLRLQTVARSKVEPRVGS